MRLPVFVITVLLAAGPAPAAVNDAGRVRPPAPTNPEKPAGKTEVSPGTRGQLLYENHCQSCHTSRLHIRENRRVKSIAELRGWVMRWSQTLKLNWSQEEIDDVAGYLNRRFYKLTVRR